MTWIMFSARPYRDLITDDFDPMVDAVPFRSVVLRADQIAAIEEDAMADGRGVACVVLECGSAYEVDIPFAQLLAIVKEATSCRGNWSGGLSRN
jgi:hypothetical protein